MFFVLKFTYKANLLLIFSSHFFFIKLHSKPTFTTVVSIFMVSHENTSTANVNWAFFPLSFDLSGVVYFVELQSRELDFGALVLDLLWGGVNLFLSFTTTPKHWMNDLDGRFFLKVFKCGVVHEEFTIGDEVAGQGKVGFELGYGCSWVDLDGVDFSVLDEDLHCESVS